MALGQAIRNGCIVLGSKFNTAYGTGGVNIFTPDLVPGDLPCICRVNATFSATGTLTLVRKYGTGTMYENLGTTIASGLYASDFIVNENESINFRFSGTGTIYSINVAEI